MFVVGDHLNGATILVDGEPVPTDVCTTAPAPITGVPQRVLCFVAPPHPAGVVTVVARAADGTLSNTVHLAYTETPAPVIITTRPDHGPDVGGTRVQLTGDHFEQGVAYVDETPAGPSTCGSNGQVFCFVAPPHAPGMATVTVRTGDGKASNGVSFRYDATPPPHIQGIEPSHGPDVGGTRARVSGMNLDQGVVYVDGVAATTSPCPVFFGRDELCFTTPPHSAGTSNVEVRTPDGKVSNGLTFTYDATPPPELRTLQPSQGRASGGTVVLVFGSHLEGTTVLVDGVAVTSRLCPNRFGSVLCFTAPPHAPGVAQVTVRSPDGKLSNALEFRYT